MLPPPLTPATRGIISPFFFFNDTATTEIYTLSLHDALPISFPDRVLASPVLRDHLFIHHNDQRSCLIIGRGDRKSTRLNSSHANISYAVFCLKKKNYRTQPSCRSTCCTRRSPTSPCATSAR